MLLYYLLTILETHTVKKLRYITDPEILAIPIVECHEPLIDIKTQNQLQYGPPPESELTASDYTKLRKTVFEKLCQVQASLPHQWRIRLYEGFRSISVQQTLFEEEQQRVRERYPHLSEKQVFQEATRMASPTINADGSQNTPAHNTGGAVDIEIITPDGELVDMGMAVKDWCHIDPALSLTDCTSISATAKHHRKILLDLMHAQGFVNYPTEWWHFSYGDRYWAYYQNAPHAIYGSADEL